ncbi:MAG: TIGR03943 family putative permease subunit [Rubrobacter sp.]
MPSLGTYLAISLFNVHALALYLGGQLTLYIHPRYVLFTVALNVVSLAACCAGFSATAWRVANGSYAGGASWRPSVTFLMAMVVLLAAYALPARTLSTETADQRIGNFNSARSPSSATGGTLAAFRTGETPTLAGAATADLAIEDWVAAFGVEPNANFYEGKEVNVVGFVFRAEGTPDDVFYVSRFVVTCCAVDAQPIGLPVRSPGWQERFEDDAWVRVKGRFANETGVAEPVVVEPERVERTAQPPNPYVN